MRLAAWSGVFSRTCREGVGFYFLISALLISCMPCSPAISADIKSINKRTFDDMNNGNIDADISMSANLVNDAAMICNVVVSGSITPGDAEQLDRILSAYPELNQVRVCFDSPGGSFAEGIKIAALLADKGIGTGIDAGAQCYSACALAFMGGRSPFGGLGTGTLNRYLHVRGKLGFHAPYIGGHASNTSVPAEKLVEAYNAAVNATNQLVKLGQKHSTAHLFPPELVREMLDKGPAELFGIDTVGKAIRYRIGLVGSLAPAFTVEAICNACLNYHLIDPKAEAKNVVGVGIGSCGSAELANAKSKTFSSGQRWILDVAPRGGQCVIDVVANGRATTAWGLHADETSTFPEAMNSVTLSYWYLFKHDTVIDRLPVRRANATQTERSADAVVRGRNRPEPSDTVRDADLLDFISQVYLPGLAEYSDKVDYYEKGTVPKAFVLDEQVKRRRKWPSQTYTLEPATLKITRRELDHFDLVFNFSYLVSNPQRSASGRGAAYVQVWRVGGKFLVTAVREVVRRN